MFFVSIIIPTFNRCTLLRRALNSIAIQTFPHYEIIVIDDGSTDDTAKMINRFFPNVKYYYQTNSGVSSSRNKGLSLARGDWIAFLDSDDQWLPEKLEKQITQFKLNPSYKICHTHEQWIRDGVKVNQMNKHKKFGGWIFPHCLPLCAMSPSSIIIHQSVFSKVGVFDTSLPACEDYDLWLRICSKYPVLFIEEPLLLKYGGHPDQLSKKHWGMDRFRIQSLDKLLSNETLTVENKQLATAILLKKCTIFKNGALKRGKIDDADKYQLLINKFQ